MIYDGQQYQQNANHLPCPD